MRAESKKCAYPSMPDVTAKAGWLPTVGPIARRNETTMRDGQKAYVSAARGPAERCFRQRAAAARAVDRSPRRAAVRAAARPANLPLDFRAPPPATLEALRGRWGALEARLSPDGESGLAGLSGAPTKRRGLRGKNGGDDNARSFVTSNRTIQGALQSMSRCQLQLGRCQQGHLPQPQPFQRNG